MGLISWIGDLFGSRWTDAEVVQFNGDQFDHGFDTTDQHIQQLRNRRPSLHQHQRLLVDAKIRELEHNLKLAADREHEAKLKHEEEQRLKHIKLLAEQDERLNEDRQRRRANKQTFDIDLDIDDAPSSDFKSWGHTAPVHSTPVSSYHHSSSHSNSHNSSSHSHSHSCSGSSHSHSDSGGGDSGGGGGCD